MGKETGEVEVEVEVSEQETPFHLLPQEEQKRIIELNQKRVREAPTLHEWDIRVPEAYAWTGILIVTSFMTFVMGGSCVIITHGNDWSFFYIALFASIAMTPCFRYLIMADKDYHYRLTTEGLIVTYQDAIPDVAYTIARGLAWVGVAVCVLAVVVLGPLALVGAGGMALLSVFFTNFKNEKTINYISFNPRKVNLVKVVRNEAYVRCETVPIGYAGLVNFHCHKSELDKVLSLLLPRLNCNEYREFKSIFSLLRAPHSTINVGMPRKLDEFHQ